MSTEIRVPTLGESVTEATIGQWFKQVGDSVAADARGLVVSSINSAGYFLEDGRVSSAALHENENLLRAAERLGGVHGDSARA